MRAARSTAGTAAIGAWLIAAGCAGAPEQPAPERPNVVLILTDDQGYGDFGFAGNPILRTPHLDALAARSARLERFYVSPVCTPTRAALMTGRHPQRTRAFDTWVGRAMLEPEEVTLAEALGAAGYATGIFGKWHLGDCYPMRPMDQGFEESLVHRGGGIGQPADPEGGEGQYTDPVLFHNGERVETEGYCTDVYFDAAIDWMARERAADRPFFAYVATNAPHGPLHDVPQELYAAYAALDLSPGRFPQDWGVPLPGSYDEDVLARIYAMIENIDQNVGALIARLEDMGALENTLVIFLVDNGPNSQRYRAGLRGTKGAVYEGGVRTPLLAHWPARLEPGAKPEALAAHIDLMPTVLDACGVAPPRGVDLDGRSFLPLLEDREVERPERTLVIQAHRGNEAVRYHHFLAVGDRFKLVNASGFGRELEQVEPAFELYDLELDPFEQHDLSAERPELVAELVAAYDAWFDDVSSTRPDNYAPPRIVLGHDAARRVDLTRQDWRRAGAPGSWGPDALGAWQVDVLSEGPYRVRVVFLEEHEVERVRLRLGELEVEASVEAGSSERVFETLRLPLGPGRLEVEVQDGERELGAYQVILTH